MERLLKLAEDYGPVGGVGLFLFLASWGLALQNTTDFEIVKLKNLPPVQVIAVILAIVGLLCVAYQLKRSKAAADTLDKVSDDDLQLWKTLLSFLEDRRALYTAIGYENLPSMLRSVREMRGFVGDCLNRTDRRSSLRAVCAEIQKGCREFDQHISEIDQKIKDAVSEGDTSYELYQKLENDSSLSFLDCTPYVTELIPPSVQFDVITSAGVLRGKMASAIERYASDHDIPSDWKTLTQMMTFAPAATRQAG